MARRPARTQTGQADLGSGSATAGDNTTVPPGTTGRYLVLFRHDAIAAGSKMLSSVAGLKVARSSDFEGSISAPGALGGAEALVFSELGVAVVDSPPDQINALGVEEDKGILAVEAERVVYAIDDGPDMSAGIVRPAAAFTAQETPFDYLRGYRDAVNNLYDKLTGGAGEAAVGAEAAAGLSETEFTWGLQAAKVPASQYTGKGIRVAVLDTGFDVGHPDFAGRSVTTASFVQGQTVQDGHGHGTHCIGTSCGPRRPGTMPRYGIAFEAEIFAGKVLSNQGSGGDAGILAGIEWALTNRCAVISMSLGAPVQPGQSYSRVYEQVARRCLTAGTLIIAAAGNESHRPQVVAPVGHPANCPSIMAVAAIDRNFRVAYFSCAGLNPQGGQVDIAGPGVDIRSSWPRPTLYRSISGTSMATPHVAGVAALYAQVDSGFRGRVLMSMLTQSARRLSLPARDVGSGLVQAP